MASEKQIRRRTRREAIAKAMTCPHCLGLCAIHETGLLCLNGCGGLRPFPLAAQEAGLLEWLRAHEPWELAGLVSGLLRRHYPAQIVERRTAGEIAPLSPAAPGTRRPPPATHQADARAA